jgi:hypothetical protein
MSIVLLIALALGVFTALTFLVLCRTEEHPEGGHEPW